MVRPGHKEGVMMGHWRYRASLAVLCCWTGAASASLPVYQLTAAQGRFVPTVLTLPAGQKVQLVVHNLGPAPEEFESSDLNQEQVVVPGASIRLFLGPLRPGTYTFFGDFHPATARGQIIVK